MVYAQQKEQVFGAAHYTMLARCLLFNENMQYLRFNHDS